MGKKIDRRAIYAKYNGHCAYCGAQIPYKEMQIDHIMPKANGGNNDMDNLNPSCHVCNHFKALESLDMFRKQVATIMGKVKQEFIYRVAKAYGMVVESRWDGKFYFEKTHGSLVIGNFEYEGKRYTFMEPKTFIVNMEGNSLYIQYKPYDILVWGDSEEALKEFLCEEIAFRWKYYVEGGSKAAHKDSLAVTKLIDNMMADITVEET